jgi:Ca-activated chloride channel family protein
LDLAHQGYLWLFTLLPLLMAWVVRGRRRRSRDWSALGQGGRLRGDGAAGWLAAIACLVVALTQPRWGRVPSPPLPPGRDVVVLVDDSRSMGVEDAVPNRLGVAVEAAESLVEALGREPGNRVAVVAFAGRGVVRCPLTENLGAAIATLRSLRPGDVRPGGTDLGAGLATAREAFGNQDHAGGRTIVLFSDGEDHVGAWDRTFEQLRAAGIVVHAVAVGDAEHGHPVPTGQGTGTLSYRGAPVVSRRVDRPLGALALATGGVVVPLGLAPADLGDLYLKRIDPVARQNRLAFRSTERAEQFPWFVLAALGLGLAGSWPGRGGRWGSPRPGRLARRGAAAIAVVCLGASAGAGAGAGATREEASATGNVEAGRSAYDAGRWDKALAAFEQAMALDPDAAVPRYDAAATLFQMKRYAEALDHYRAARERADPALRTRIDYALGNTALALGDIAGAIRHYDACINSTASGPGLDTIRADATINRRFAEAEARRLPTPPKSEDGSSPAPRSRPPGSTDPDETRPDPPGSGTSPPANGEDTQGVGTSGRRGAGGAGGSGTAPPPGGTPDQRLDAALERVREALRHRLPEPTPPAAVDDRKDW